MAVKKPQVRPRGRTGDGLKPRNTYGSAEYVSWGFFELNHGRFLANYILGGGSFKFSIYSPSNASEVQHALGYRTRDEDAQVAPGFQVRGPVEGGPLKRGTAKEDY
ncbi:unnamed protein product [Heligmosomoides polygyrus]|uniref:KTSC domain-containing protein n=1 Tax=Heligmosomoides polygyrus TaxID=6339 RepID=A0A183GCD0_HELPZ|nr:unnamed protein product [Heligmosomoides polygyrus]